MPTHILSEKEAPYQIDKATEHSIIGRARVGVLRSFADNVAGMVGLTDNEMAYVLGMTPRNLHRISPDKTFSRDASERLILFRNILLHALDTFEGSKPAVLHWLRTPIAELSGQSPIELLDTVTGFGLVNDVLGRLDHGLPA